MACIHDIKKVPTTSSKRNHFRGKKSSLLLGLYLANENDAKISKNILEDSSGLRNCLKMVILLYLIAVSVMLYVVMRNKSLKYRLFYHKIDNELLPKVGSYSRLASFKNNTFRRRFLSDRVVNNALNL